MIRGQKIEREEVTRDTRWDNGERRVLPGINSSFLISSCDRASRCDRRIACWSSFCSAASSTRTREGRERYECKRGGERERYECREGEKVIN